MTDPAKLLQELIGGGSLKESLYPPTSRYHGIEITATESASGRPVAFLRRRFVPAPERFATLTEHAVEESDRLDRLSARYLGDPLLFWRLADANGGVRPDELTERAGRRLKITLPEGVPGPKRSQ
jgi:hypothetical protein